MPAPEKHYPLDISEFAPQRRGTIHFMSKEHEEAIQWLNTMAGHLPWAEYGRDGMTHARGIQKILETQRETAVRECIAAVHGRLGATSVTEALEALIAPPAPKTKTAWDVTVVGVGPMERCKREEQVLDVVREFGAKHEIKIVPCEVPAD